MVTTPAPQPRHAADSWSGAGRGGDCSLFQTCATIPCVLCTLLCLSKQRGQVNVKRGSWFAKQGSGGVNLSAKIELGAA
eukprot:5265631-Amphidinium_carterae.2